MIIGTMVFVGVGGGVAVLVGRSWWWGVLVRLCLVWVEVSCGKTGVWCLKEGKKRQELIVASCWVVGRFGGGVDEIGDVWGGVFEVRVCRVILQ